MFIEDSADSISILHMSILDIKLLISPLIFIIGSIVFTSMNMLSTLVDIGS